MTVSGLDRRTEAAEKKPQHAYELAAFRNHPGGQWQVGYYYFHGCGKVEQDYAKAAEWFDKAYANPKCHGKNKVRAAAYLGVCYQEGLGVVQDDDLALEYLQEAEEDIDDLWEPVNGMVLNALGVAYAFGRGTEEDVELGYQYFEDAARLGSEEAKEHLQLINSPEYDSVGQAACITPTKELDSFYSGLAKRVREAAAMDLQEVLAKIGDERIYAFALVTDSDCASLFMAVNTVEYLISYGGPQSPAMWLPDEWGYSDSDSGELSKLSGLLLQHSEQLPGQDYFVDALISAIKQLKAAGVFGEHTDDITYFVSMSDAEAAERIEDYSAKQLNPPVMASIFLNRNK